MNPREAANPDDLLTMLLAWRNGNKELALKIADESLRNSRQEAGKGK